MATLKRASGSVAVASRKIRWPKEVAVIPGGGAVMATVMVTVWVSARLPVKLKLAGLTVIAVPAGASLTTAFHVVAVALVLRKVRVKVHEPGQAVCLRLGSFSVRG